MKKMIILMLLGFFVSTNIAQTFDVGAQLRTRGQFDGKDFNSDTDPFGYTELRSRINLSIEADRGISGFFQIQDSRIYGTEPSTLADTKNLDLHQGYIKVNKIFGLPFDVKFGRQEVALANQRLIGSVGWHPVGRSFDGSIVTLRLKKADIHFLGFQVNESLNFGDTLDVTFGGVWAELELIKNYKTDFFALNQSVWGTDQTLWTLGLYAKGNHGGFSHEIEFAYQMGDNGTGLDYAAMMFAYNAAYKVNSKLNPVVSAGVDYIGGDDDPTDDKIKTFNTLYATNHKFYGHMDYFLNLPVNTYGVGLMDIHAKLSIMPWKKIKLGFNGHMFNSAEDFTLADGSTSKDFGIELDFYAALKYSKNLTFQGGVSIFSPGDIFKQLRGEDSALWVYGMAVVNL
jgi:hypothetical protein